MKLDYESRRSGRRSGGWRPDGLATALAILILVALLAAAVWLGYFIASLA